MCSGDKSVIGTTEMQCTKCRRDAIVYQRYSGLHLCEHHFVLDLEAKAKRAIRKHRWIDSGDSVGVALSGDLASSAVLFFMHRLLHKRRDIILTAITVDEGIAGYRDPGRAEAIARTIGAPLVTASFADAYGITLDEFARRKGRASACSACRVLRENLLNRVAREHGVTKLVFGTTLDDGAVSVLADVFRGDAESFRRPALPVPGTVPRIRPFMDIPGEEVSLYAALHLDGFDLAECPYAGNAFREDVRSLLDEYASRHPATKNALVNLGEELSGALAAGAGPTRICERCGEPSGETCRCCRILDEARGYEGA